MGALEFSLPSESDDLDAVISLADWEDSDLEGEFDWRKIPRSGGKCNVNLRELMRIMCDKLVQDGGVIVDGIMPSTVDLAKGDIDNMLRCALKGTRGYMNYEGWGGEFPNRRTVDGRVTKGTFDDREGETKLVDGRLNFLSCEIVEGLISLSKLNSRVFDEGRVRLLVFVKGPDEDEPVAVSNLVVSNRESEDNLSIRDRLKSVLRSLVPALTVESDAKERLDRYSVTLDGQQVSIYDLVGEVWHVTKGHKKVNYMIHLSLAVDLREKKVS